MAILNHRHTIPPIARQVSRDQLPLHSSVPLAEPGPPGLWRGSFIARIARSPLRCGKSRRYRSNGSPCSGLFGSPFATLS